MKNQKNYIITIIAADYLPSYLSIFNIITKLNENGSSCIENFYVQKYLNITLLKYAQILFDYFPFNYAVHRKYMSNEDENE